MLQHNDTIAAIATAYGRGGIGVVRVSGPLSEAIAKSITKKKLKPRNSVYTSFFDHAGNPIDNGIAIFFSAPNSFTGENVVELQGHGGTAIIKLVLNECIKLGARLAEPGEFTLRAFLNQKIDLIQAESISDIIEASTEQSARSALRSLQGGFSTKVQHILDQLIDLRMYVEATLDFPEEEISAFDISECRKRSETIIAATEQLLTQAKQGALLNEGIHIALVGRPNAGKSSLLNKLSDDEIALVSEIAGTTRDAIRQSISINGVPVHLVDTAGLRETEDKVEALGIERTKQEILKTDLALVIIDGNENILDQYELIDDFLPKNTKKIIVINKIDLKKESPRSEESADVTYVYLSALTGEGINLLREKILDSVGWNSEATAFIARERHLILLTEFFEYLLKTRNETMGLELQAENLRLAQVSLSKVTGEYTSDDLLGEIFKGFCIGK